MIESFHSGIDGSILLTNRIGFFSVLSYMLSTVLPGERGGFLYSFLDFF
jgi:hypothetical protein